MAGRKKMSRVASLILALEWLFAGSKLLSADTNTVLDGWFAAQKNLQTWSADFVQTRKLKSLTRPLVAVGHVDFAMSGEFRWELGRPARSIAVGRSNEMIVIYPLLKRAERYSLGPDAPGQWRDAISLLQAGFPHGRKQFEAQFGILSLTRMKDGWELVLQSKSQWVRQMMPEVCLCLATNSFSLQSTELTFADGSRMRNDFTNQVLNPKLDGGIFTWQPPADFKITEPLSK